MLVCEAAHRPESAVLSSRSYVTVKGHKQVSREKEKAGAKVSGNHAGFHESSLGEVTQDVPNCFSHRLLTAYMREKGTRETHSR